MCGTGCLGKGGGEKKTLSQNLAAPDRGKREGGEGGEVVEGNDCLARPPLPPFPAAHEKIIYKAIKPPPLPSM